MKESYNTLKKNLMDVNSSLSSLLTTVQNQTDIADRRFDEWQKVCSDIRYHIAEDVVRVAVIGPVKSGKSTLVNSLFRNDYLKRGAGIMTSIVTRIRTGSHLKAVLFFKSWDEVNADIGHSLIMLPTWDRTPEDGLFDIRREPDRRALQSALDQLTDDLLITEGVRNTGTVLLSLYLKGYDKIRPILSSGSLTAEFSDDHFTEHQTYVGNDELAVYLRDAELEIVGKTIDRSIEIADCQGSDSPNPLHMAMIQDYLLRTHFIVYVISSRIGLRQADIRFLSIIKKMGILDNILFVINCDFSEHESIDDLHSLIKKVREDLSILRPDPELFSFSALFNLFSSSAVTVTSRDSMRLSHWMEEKELVSFSNRESQRFQFSLNEKLTRERFSILLRNHIERMDVIVSGIIRWASMHKEASEKDAGSISEMIGKISLHQDRMAKIKDLTTTTLRGATDKKMKELKMAIDRFFNVQTSGVMGQTLDYVREYSVSVEKYRANLKISGFSSTLYLVFQDFKRALDTFITETIDPEIARYVREMEEDIETYLNSVAGPYHSMPSHDITELTEAIRKKLDHTSPPSHRAIPFFDIDTVKQIAGLSLPSSSTALRYSPKVRTEAIVRLGFYSVANLVKKILKKPAKKEKDEQLRALADGVEIIKSETEASIFFHFENYRENFKFQYIAKLLEASEQYLYKLLMERFESYSTDIKALERIVEKKGSEREYIVKFLQQIFSNAQKLHNDIQSFREKMNQDQKVHEKKN